MKKLSTLSLSAFLFSGLIFAESTENTSIFRISGLLVDEIIDGGDSGIGATAEYAFIIHKADNFFTAIGYELGFIQSEIKEGTFEKISVDTTNSESLQFDIAEIETRLIPAFINYRFRGGLKDPKTFWECGAGFGVILVDVDMKLAGLPNLNDDDLIFGGQVFGRLGYDITKTVKLLFGVRYMMSEDFDFQDSTKDIENEDLDIDIQLDEIFGSVAFDISFNFVF